MSVAIPSNLPAASPASESSSRTALVIHGHFYQPPRENPWTGILEREPSASPDHDWNDRIYRECYRANAFARIFDGFGHVDRIVNNYARLSFNFGPTLLSWIEAEHPVTYARILDADRISVGLQHGHGNAIAQGYNHVILPLCNDRDRKTQVRWGLADFRHRFGREPESLWLPETACNDETLGTLIDEGLAYVILSPYQAERVRPLRRPTEAPDSEGWVNVADGSIDPGVAYRYFHRDGSGRSIAIFFYDGPVARSVAFEGSLASSQAFVGRLAQVAGGAGRVVNIATDGESYGHHSHFGDLTLAYALDVEAATRGFEVTNYGAFLAGNPPQWEVEIKPGPNGEGTAWSCAHGVGRWARDCGCSTGAREGWNQRWRAPLRAALDLLRDAAAAHLEGEGGELFRDPWAARDAYIELVLDRQAARDAWLERHRARPLSSREQERALTLLELARSAMLMYTSCGWFFADISGIETVQVLKYAGRVLDLLDDLDLPAPRARFLEVLAEAQSNLPEMGNGADVFRRFVEPLRVSPARVAAHLAIVSLVDERHADGETAGFRYKRQSFQHQKHGRITLATARIDLEEIATRKRYDFALAAMHMGAVDFYCCVRPFPGAQRFANAAARLWQSFRTAALPQLLRMTNAEFGPDEYGLESLLPDGRERISAMAFGDIVSRFAQQYVTLYESNQRILEMLQEAGFELPKEISAAAEFTLGRRFEEEIIAARDSFEPAAYGRALALASEIARHGYTIDRKHAAHVFGVTLARAVVAAVSQPDADRVARTVALAELGHTLGLTSDIGRAQEILFEAIATAGAQAGRFAQLARALAVRPPAAPEEAERAQAPSPVAPPYADMRGDGELHRTKTVAPPPASGTPLAGFGAGPVPSALHEPEQDFLRDGEG